MTDQQPMSPEPCEHHWIHYGQPNHSPIRWIVKCSQCHQFKIEDLQEQVDVIEAAARIEGLRLAQQIISGDLPVNESRDRHDMVNAGYLIRELDEEIRDQTLGEQDDD